MSGAAAGDLVCAGCGRVPPPVEAEPYPFRCAAADSGDDVDHVITCRVDASSARIDPAGGENPFVRYREILYSYRLARSRGLADADYREIVERLCAGIARIEGEEVRRTPLARSASIARRLGMTAPGAMWIKDETGNVSGSHKARHLTGLMIYLKVVERLGLSGPAAPELAIASCGNAALAAATVARAAGRCLRVFVPATANRHVLSRLAELGAAVEICAREASAAGDPAYHRFRDAVRRGAVPFCCQGPDNGLTIEGAETLVFEMIEALDGAAIDRLFVQVGGGALASACVRGFARAKRLGLVDRVPRIHAVQTRGAFPLARAYARVAALAGEDRMQQARAHRSQFMWPWEAEPRSVAHGILDDETYDWAAVVEGMLDTGGSPIVVDEVRLEAANALAREATAIDVDHTGSAGLAGVVNALAADPSIGGESIAVIFSGRRRPLTA